MESTQRAWNIIIERLQSWNESLISNLPIFAVAIIILVGFSILSKLVRNLLYQGLKRSIKNEALTSLLGTLAQIVVLIVGLSVALGILHLDKTVTSLLAGAGVIGLALGFAFQDIASNFISGIFIAFREPYKIGDVVEVEGYCGVVKEIDLRTTLIETFQGIQIYIPNQYMFTKPLKNFSGEPIRRLDFEVGVSYAEDLRKVEALIQEALSSLEGRLSHRPVEVFFKNFGNSSIDCDVCVWIHYSNNRQYVAFRHQAIIAIKEIFDKNSITIPFPIRTLDFGIKGGQNLQTPLIQALRVQRKPSPSAEKD